MPASCAGSPDMGHAEEQQVPLPGPRAVSRSTASVIVERCGWKDMPLPRRSLVIYVRCDVCQMKCAASTRGSGSVRKPSFFDMARSAAWGLQCGGGVTASRCGTTVVIRNGGLVRLRGDRVPDAALCMQS